MQSYIEDAHAYHSYDSYDSFCMSSGGKPDFKAPYTKSAGAIVAPVTAAVLAAVIPLVIILTILFAVFLYMCKKRRASLTSAPTVPRSCATLSPETLHNYYPALEGELAVPTPGDTSEDANSQMQHPVPPYYAYIYDAQDIPPDYYVVTSRDNPPAYRTLMTRSVIRKMVIQHTPATTQYHTHTGPSALPVSTSHQQSD